MSSARRSLAGVSEVLGSLALFSSLSERSAQTLAETCRLRSIVKGEILFFQQDPPEAAYVLRSGRMSMLVSNVDGRFLVLDDMHPGDLFGELGPLTSQPHSASALARADSEVLVIPRAIFLKLVQDEPRLARRVLEITAGRLHRSVQRAAGAGVHECPGAAGATLAGARGAGGGKGYVTASQEDLAGSTGLIRQTVAKALGAWRRDGWLKTSRGRILILNRGALEAAEKG